MTIFRFDSEHFSLLLRAEDGVACLRLIGEIDLDCEQVLTHTGAELGRLAPQRVLVDLAEVSFAGATLVNFLVRIVRAAPPTRSTVLCRPTRQTVRLLRITSTDSIAARSDHLPDAWLERHTTEGDGRPDRTVRALDATPNLAARARVYDRARNG